MTTRAYRKFHEEDFNQGGAVGDSDREADRVGDTGVGYRRGHAGQLVRQGPAGRRLRHRSVEPD